MIKYYNIMDDIQKYPNAWCYLIIGGRKRGKTYSTLKYAYEHGIDFIFIKRTMDDVDLMCSGTGKIGNKLKDYGVDLDPFKAINRDTGSNIKAYSIKSGIAGFWETTTDVEGNLVPSGSPVGTVFALNGVTKYKGIELASSNMDQWIIFDEFIPNTYDRVNRGEGRQLLDFYMTVSRDRVQRGLNEIKLICLANATSINNPVFQTLEVVDTVAEMQSTGRSELYLDDGTYIHQLEDSPEFLEQERKTGLYKRMAETDWGQMTYSNKFAYNDFSSVKRSALKHYVCVTAYRYKKQSVYVYYNDGRYYLCESQSNKVDRVYDLNRENEQKAFFRDWVITLRDACIDDMVYFSKYTMYDLIVNYKKIFSL